MCGRLEPVPPLRRTSRTGVSKCHDPETQLADRTTDEAYEEMSPRNCRRTGTWERDFRAERTNAFRPPPRGRFDAGPQMEYDIPTG